MFLRRHRRTSGNIQPRGRSNTQSWGVTLTLVSARSVVSVSPDLHFLSLTQRGPEYKGSFTACFIPTGSNWSFLLEEKPHQSRYLVCWVVLKAGMFVGVLKCFCKVWHQILTLFRKEKGPNHVKLFWRFMSMLTCYLTSHSKRKLKY